MEALIALIGFAGVIAQADQMKACEAGILQGELDGPVAVEYLQNYDELHRMLHTAYTAYTPDLTETDRYAVMAHHFMVAKIDALTGELEFSLDNCNTALEWVKD